MARIRTIKPEFFVSAQIADVSPTCRLLFVGMWIFCDDAGIHPASPRQLKMEVFPGDDFTTEQVQEMVSDLLRVGLIEEYAVSDGTQTVSYWQVTGWHHQKIERPRYQYPKQNSTTCRRHIDDTSTIPRSLTLPETTVRDLKRCARPTIEDVRSYASDIRCTDPDGFFDHYEANGWKVGRNPMKDWRSALRNWKRRQPEFASNGRKGEPAPAAALDESYAEAQKRIARTRAEYINACRNGE